MVVQEFMGRNLLAMNVMWKYREQVSFFSLHSCTTETKNKY
jgi:hypothetical protein